MDLTQWLSFPTPYSFGDTFEFVDGVNDSLPGIQIATSPFAFDAASGFVSSDLWDGTGIVLGEVDGKNIPEPGALGLALLGLAALVAPLRRRGRTYRRYDVSAYFAL